jgi:hypothetical protein
VDADGGRGEFLPPEAPGPEPELGGAQQQRPAPPAGQPAPQEQDWQPPSGQPAPQRQGWQPPPGQSPPGAWQPPHPTGWQPPPWGYGPASSEPDNGAAIAGFVTSVVAGALLLMSFGFLGLLTLIAAPFGIHYSRKGKRAVQEGKTRKHAGLAQAGFVIGIVTLVLSLIATVVAIIFIVALATDESFRRDFENNDGGGGFDSTSLLLGLAAARAALRLLA